MKVRYSKRVLAELDSILSDLNAKNPVAAAALASRVSRIADRLSRFPEGYQEVAERPGVRRVPLVQYPYLIFYKVIANEVIVLRIAHGARQQPWESL